MKSSGVMMVHLLLISSLMTWTTGNYEISYRFIPMVKIPGGARQFESFFVDQRWNSILRRTLIIPIMTSFLAQTILSVA